MLRALGSELTPKDLDLELHQKRGRRAKSVERALHRQRGSDASSDDAAHEGREPV
jgi:hypothetical protein